MKDPHMLSDRSGLTFLHVPKTAGTSVRTAICRAKGIEKPLVVFDRSCFGRSLNFESGDFPYKDLIKLTPSEFPSGEKFVTGHLALSTLRAAYPENFVFTILREPRCRLLSHWLFWRGFGDDILVPWRTWGERMRIARGPLRGFLTDGSVSSQTDNLLVRMLLWPDPRIPDDAFIADADDDTLLDDARRALASLDFVGLAEDPGLTANLGAALGIPLDISRTNETQGSGVAPRPLFSEEFNSSTLDALAARTRLDAVLWGEAFARLPGDGSPRGAADAFFLRLLMRYLGTGLAMSSRDHEAIYASRADLESCRAANDAAKVEIATLRASMSWRITAPLRKLGNVGKRLRNRS